MRLFTKVTVLAVVATLGLAAVAQAHTLPWKPAHKLAIKLAKREAQTHKTRSWRVFGGQRISKHEIDWVYNVDYADGTLCDANIRVFYVHSTGSLARAKFTDVNCYR